LPFLVEGTAVIDIAVKSTVYFFFFFFGKERSNLSRNMACFFNGCDFELWIVDLAVKSGCCFEKMTRAITPSF